MEHLTHLNALEVRLSHERVRLQNAQGSAEREIRGAWVSGIEREIAAEREFLGLPPETSTAEDHSDDDLLFELGL